MVGWFGLVWQLVVCTMYSQLTLGMQVTFAKCQTTGLVCAVCKRNVAMFENEACAACASYAQPSCCTPTNRCIACIGDSRVLDKLNKVQTFMGYTKQHNTKCEVWRCLLCNNDILFEALGVHHFYRVVLRILASKHHNYVCEAIRSGEIQF